MSFIPSYAKWVQDRMEYVPQRTLDCCGDISGMRVLNVGCGDMLADIGMLPLGVQHINGIDILERSWDVVEYAASEVRRHGYTVAADYTSRLTYRRYDGTHFPFEDNSFDFVFCWGVAEHIADVKAVLHEMRRVANATAQIFVVVSPWFHCYTGSHLSDFINEPYFQLKGHSDAWVYQQLENFLQQHPEQANQHLEFYGPNGCFMREFLLNVMWNEYRNLNRYSARRFLTEAMNAGLLIERLESEIAPLREAKIPDGVARVDVQTVGSTIVFRSGK